MKNTEIKKIYRGADNVVALFLGDDVVYKPVKRKNNILAGSFSEPGEYAVKLNNVTVPIEINDDLSFELEFNNLTSCTNTFWGLDKLVTITSFPDTSKVTYFANVFTNCTSLLSVNFEGCVFTDKCTNIINLCNNCTSLVRFNFGVFDFSNCNRTGSRYFIFPNCKNLTTVTGCLFGIINNIPLTDCPLTHSSALVFINGLSDIEETKSITFKSTTYDTLTEEDIALATSRGWNVVSA